MQKKLQEKLIRKFLHLKNHNTRYPYDIYGIECGDGWYPLLGELNKKIAEELNNYPELKDKFEVHQIKEKLGGLRFYCVGTNKRIDEIISEFEGRSYRTCEDCGGVGKKQNDNWLYTLCDPCFNKVKERKNGF